jgi:hypothetical protein
MIIKLYLSLCLCGCLFFNSKSAFPQLLVNSPINIEIVTTSVVEAFTSVVASIANFTIDNASLTYESIVVPYSYKEALLG